MAPQGVPMAMFPPEAMVTISATTHEPNSARRSHESPLPVVYLPNYPVIDGTPIPLRIPFSSRCSTPDR